MHKEGLAGHIEAKYLAFIELAASSYSRRIFQRPVEDSHSVVALRKLRAWAVTPPPLTALVLV